MSLAFWYWLFMAVWLIFGAMLDYRARATFGQWWWGRPILFFILFLIIGLKLFSDPITTLVK